MSEWWETDVSLEVSPAKLPAKPDPPELSEVDLYRAPSQVTIKWVEAQLSRQAWRDNRSSLNPQLITAMARDAAKGLSKRSIMARAGFGPRTWDQWVRKAEEGLEPYGIWYRSMLISFANKEQELLDMVDIGAETDWKAAKWRLEQINKEDYAESKGAGHTVNINGDMKQENSVNYLSQDDALQVAGILKTIGALNSATVIDAEVVEEGDSN